MKLEEIGSGIPFLPEEIIINILKRLPVKSLIRFRSVCHLWKNVINAHFFVIDHLNHSNHQIPPLLTALEGPSTLNFYSLDLDMELRNVKVGPPIGSFKADRIIGSCNGLLCVLTGRLDALPPTLSIWNPAIGEVMPVPTSRTVNDDMEVCNMGYGFSPFVNDYKIVITYSSTWDDVVNGVEVYSLATNSWKDIGFGCLEGRWFFSLSRLSVNGSIFWLARKSSLAFEDEEEVEVYSLFIVSFDLELEEFELISAPPLPRKGETKLTLYENRLALLYSCTDPDSSYTAIDLWVIEEGIGASWSKKFTFGPYPYEINPWTICRNQIVCTILYISTVLFEEGEEGLEIKVDVFLIDLTSNEFKVIDGSNHNNGYSGDSYEYVESLLSPSNIHLRNP